MSDPDTRILVTGAAGFLGWNLARELTRAGCRVRGVHHTAPPDASLDAEWTRLDLADPSAPASLRLDDVRLIVHCAAVASVRSCDEDRDRAWRVNVDAARGLAEAASARAVPFILISTDLVFDGTRGPYREDDPVSPASWYAETKCAAEDAVRAAGGAQYIFRTALMYGTHRRAPGSFLGWTLAALRAGTPLQLYTTQTRNPLYAVDVAAAVLSAMEPLPSGTYHLGGPDALSRHALGLRIARAWSLPADAVRGVPLERDALGPRDDTTLDTTRIRRAAGLRFTALDDGLARVRDETA